LVSIIIVAVLIPHGLGSAEVAIPIALAVGLGVGTINGLLVTVLRYRPVLATLCTLFVLQGASLKLLSQPMSGSTNWLTDLGNQVGPIPGGLILIIAPVLAWLGLARSPYTGRYTPRAVTTSPRMPRASTSQRCGSSPTRSAACSRRSRESRS
jgi:ribose transport system permease protein